MATTTTKQEIWDTDGQILGNAPQWATYRKQLDSEFPSPYKGGSDTLAESMKKAVELIDKLRPSGPDSPAFLGKNSKLTYNYPEVKNQKIPQKSEALDDVIADCVKLFQGLPDVSSPLTMSNVWPQPNNASIIASMLPLIFAPNIIEGEYGWNVHKAELESGGMLADLFGWEPTKAGAVYTYGGSGCWFYGLKYALTRVFPDSREKGIRADGKVLVSGQAHYCRQNATDWAGLGMDNVIIIPTDPNNNKMDLNALEATLKDLQEKQIPVVEVVCTMGTTDASVFDPIADVRRLLDKYPNPAGYGKALLYADAVCGWSWYVFKDYDFEKNPLGFSQRVLKIIKKNYEEIKGIHYADAVGVDFHKFGFAPYISSCFVYQDAAEFENIMRRGNYAYLQSVTPYNPMYYTLEVSRTASGSLAGWATLKYLGIEGLQAVLGGILEVRLYMDSLVETQPDMVMADADDTGFITLFRVYPKGIDAREQYSRELNDREYRSELLAFNRFQQAVGEKMFQWYLEGKKINGKPTPHIAYSTGFRTASWNEDGSDPEGTVYALKTYPMNVYNNPVVMDHVITCVLAARDEVEKEMK
ncbi:MAG: pyridoxal-dependent decarboxylase [Bacteroides sp.]|nr:pyridoxal-dependent decarboxylase [Bacteroides sp.]MCM1379911.1 pyridoxal-dependent decarboxylase [Bacteroides sp.]MCM1446235.1 pyridoxal-dependent decarboxylase [Prevotella sp.]